MSTSRSQTRVTSLRARPHLVGSLQSTAEKQSVFFLGALLLWWIFYVVNTLYLTGPETSEAAENGTLTNQMQVLTFSILGLAGTSSAIKRLRRGLSWPFWYLLYGTWSLASLTWTTEPSLTLRRLSQFILLSVGAIGIGAGQYGQGNGPLRMVNHLRWAGIIAGVLCLPILIPELSLSALLDPTWRTAISERGPEIPNAISFALIASVTTRAIRNKSGEKLGAFSSSTSAWIQIAFLTALLFIVKSRSMIAFALLVIALIYIVEANAGTMRDKRAFVVRSHLFAFGILLTAIVALGVFEDRLSALGDQMFTFFARENDQRALGELNGRLPLWDYVWNDITQRPWTGAGFGAYWSPFRLRSAWVEIGWSAPFAHNGYLDELAGTGILGLALLLGFFGAAIKDLLRGWRTERIGPAVRVTIGWIGFLFLCNLVDTIFQYYFKVTFIFSVALLSSCSAVVAAEFRIKHSGRAWLVTT